VVIAGDRSQPGTAALLRVLRTSYLPFTTVVLVPGEGDGSALAALAPSTPAYHPVDGEAAAYVCTGSTCAAPVTGPDALAALLGIPPPSRKP
ncbi:MAG: thioredoxin domain-containing protein, partial [Methanomicrobiales archaeon]|nr:thioredoxin domain-containing protein [Methanomicrobiales archaeon]